MGNATIDQLNIFRNKIVHIIANNSGWTNVQAEMFLLAIIGYTVMLLFFLFIHRKSIKKHKKIHESLIFLYDTIWYKVALTQYQTPTNESNKGIKVVMESSHKDYITNLEKIKEEIVGIEQKLGKKIVSDQQRENITKETKKKNGIKLFMKVLGRFITLITAGIYKLFR